MPGDEGHVIYIFYVKPIFNTRDFDSKVLLARGLSALNEGDICREMQGPGEQLQCEGLVGSERGILNELLLWSMCPCQGLQEM